MTLLVLVGGGFATAEPSAVAHTREVDPAIENRSVDRATLVPGFVLVDAGADISLFDLVEGMTLYKDDLPADLSIIYEPAQSVGSVVFDLNGPVSKDRTESGAPYALNGDNNGDYTPFDFVTGNYSLTVTLYSASGGSGSVLGTETIAFTVSNGSGPTNQPPIADAGPDQTVTDTDNTGTENITLDGTGSADTDGTIVSYAWSAPGVTIPAGASPTAAFPVGTTTVTLTVTDDAGDVATDQVTITVNAGPSNQPPVADAGPDQTVTDTDNTGTENITLDGSGSADTDGTLAGYAWSAPGVTIPAGASPTAAFPVGTTTVTLTVTDDDGAMATDEVIITVVPGPGEPSPVSGFILVDAGANISLFDLTDGITLYKADLPADLSIIYEPAQSVGSVVFDLDGPVNHDRTESGAPYALNGDSGGNYSPFDFATGDYTLTVTLYSASGGSGTQLDVVSLDFSVSDGAAPTNQAPVANAGPDQTVTDTDNSGTEDVTLDGSGSTDTDGTLAGYAWSAPGVTIPSGASPTAVFPVGTTIVTLTVTDDDGAVATDQVTIAVASGTGGGETTAPADLLYGTYLQGGANLFPNADLLRLEQGYREVYLRFDLSNFSATPTAAELTMEVAGDPGNGTLEIYLGDATDWTETGLNDSNKPLPVGTALGSVTGDHPIGATKTWSLDAGRIATGGYLTLILLQADGDDVAFASDETAEAPVLMITTTGGPPNQPPVANAGPDQTVTDADNDGTESITLDGSGSTDADGTLVSYVWTAPGVTIPAAASPTAAFPVGTTTVTLTVTDAAGAVASDSLMVTVQPAPPATGGGNPATASGRIYVATQSDGSEVRLRWVVDDYAPWRAATTNGYTIARMPLRRDGVTLSATQRFNDRVVLDSLYRPLPEADWGTTFTADPRADAARQILYSTEWDMEITGNPNFAAAVTSQENNENRLFFAHAIADQDYAVARALGLGYTDTTALANEEYAYVITVNDVTTPAGRAVLGSAAGGLGDSAAELLPVTNLSAIDGDHGVTVGWSVLETEHLYTGYDIYRASAGSPTGIKANSAPFLYGTDGENDPKYAYFTDSLATHGAYDYWVVGRTPFGLFGPPSDTIAAASRPARLPIQLVIDSLAETETEILLSWADLPASYTDSLTGFRIYRAERSAGPFELVSAGDLPAGDRAWTDSAPLPAAYYVLEADDANGHRYRSPTQLAQLADLTPPAAPTGLTGTDRGDGIIDLSWDANTEADLNGYRIYRCFVRGGSFAQIGTEASLDTALADDLRNAVVADTAYYRLLAQDHRGNFSALSPVLAVPRADITPPGKPVLHKALPTPAGVALAWRYSDSDDVVRHELHRRPTGTPHWETVLTIPNAARADYLLPDFDPGGDFNYLDETPLERREYDYLFVAVDAGERAAASDKITLRPYDSGERGTIQNLLVTTGCTDTLIRNDLDSAVLVKLETVLDDFETSGTITTELRDATLMGLEMAGLVSTADFAEWRAVSDAAYYERVRKLYATFGPRVRLRNCGVTLTWTYNLDPTVLHFQVLRSRNQSRIRPYKTLAVANFFPDGTVPSGPQTFTFTDPDAEPGVRYVYKITAVHGDGGYSAPSGAVTVVVE